jgi:hypothetical protein
MMYRLIDSENAVRTVTMKLQLALDRAIILSHGDTIRIQLRENDHPWITIAWFQNGKQTDS